MLSSTMPAPFSVAAAAQTMGTSDPAGGCGMQRCAHLLVGELGALEVFLQQGVVTFGRGVDESGVCAFDLGVHLVRAR